MFNYNKLNQLLATNSHRILALMLLALHAFLIWGEQTNYLHHTFFLCTYGFFLMWQPIWSNTEKLSLPAIILFLTIGIVGFFYANLWITAIWLALLFGLLGGRVFSEETKSNRVIHILAASYILSMLLLWVVPKLLNASNDLEAANFVITYLTPLLVIAIFFTPNTTLSKNTQLPVIDFFYTLLLTLGALLLVLSSFAIGTVNSVHYIKILFISIFGLAFGLLVFSFFWKPNTRFSGVELLMSRYLLSIGMSYGLKILPA
jgi:hypothetical protein